MREILAEKNAIKIVIANDCNKNPARGHEAPETEFDVILTIAETPTEANILAQTWLRKVPTCAVICLNGTATCGTIYQLRLATQHIKQLDAHSLPNMINEFISWRSIKEN